MYKKHFSFPLRIVGGAIIAYSIIFLYRNGVTFIPILSVFFGLLIIFTEIGFKINSQKMQIIKFVSIGLIFPYSKIQLQSKIISIKFQAISYKINFKPNPLTDISADTMKKKGFNVLLILKNNEVFIPKYFYNREDAKCLASKISKELKIPQS